jgi:hypothetical protein
MEADPLQWIWNDVDAFHDKINDLLVGTGGTAKPIIENVALSAK